MLRLILPILIVLIHLVLPAQARDGIEARSDHFTLISDAPVDALGILADLELFRSAVVADLGVTARDHAPLTLTLTDDMDVFDAVSPGGITAAIYLQSAAGADIVVGYSRDPDHLLGDALDPAWLRLVLRHEVVHHIIEAHYPRKLPIWLGEGLAEYYATFDPDPDGLAVFGRPLPEQEELSEFESWLPMRTVIESMARYPDYRSAMGQSASGDALFRAQRLYYGQASALARFVMDQPEGLTRIHRFVDGLDAASDSEDSFEAAFGLRYGSLESRVRQDIADGEASLRVSRLSVPSARVTRSVSLSEAARNTNHLRLLLAHGRNVDRVNRAIAQLRLRPGLNADALDAAEALNAWRRKDWDVSDAFAARGLARTPADARLLKIRAKTAYGRVSENQVDDALWSAAETAALDALKVAPQDAQLHLFRVAVSLPVGDRLPAQALASLDWLTARNIRQRLPHEAMMMIPALIYEGRLERADAVLDNAARWTTDTADRFVIDRLRDNVAIERARTQQE